VEELHISCITLVVNMSEIKLHLGCGKRHIPGFTHIDRDKFKHVDHVQDISDLSQFKDDSVDLIYVCHAIAYIPQLPIALFEWIRVLKPGGILRISTPDFNQLCKVYQQTGNIELIKGPLYGQWADIHHSICYDIKSLRAELVACGFSFSNVTEYDWRETEHANVDDYSQAYIPHMDKEFGTLISLNVECIK